MKYDDALRGHIDQIYRERALAPPCATFRSFNIFPKRPSRTSWTAPNSAPSAITTGRANTSASRSPAARARQEPAIAEEGDYPNGIVLIHAGFARRQPEIRRRPSHAELSRRRPPLRPAGNRPQLAQPQTPVSLQYTLRAMGYTHVIKFPRGDGKPGLAGNGPARFARRSSSRRRSPRRACRGGGRRRKGRRGDAGISHREPLFQRHGRDGD